MVQREGTEPKSVVTRSKLKRGEKVSSEAKTSKSPARKNPKKKKSSVVSNKVLLYTLMGNLEISMQGTPQIQNEGEDCFRTASMVVDKNNNAFLKTVLEVTIDEKKKIVVLDAEQVELILKILRVVDYAD